MSQSTIIHSGQTVSDPIDLVTADLVRVTTPAGWDGGNLTAQVSYDGTNYTAYVDETGAALTLVAAASKTIRVPPLDWDGVRFFKLVAASAVGADRTLILTTIERG